MPEACVAGCPTTTPACSMMGRMGPTPEAGARIHVVLADDADHFRRGLAAVLADDPGLVVVGEASDGDAAVELAARLAPDVAVIDVRMPGTGGVAATRAIRTVSPVTRVLVLTVSDEDEDLMAAVVAGAHGYLLKDSAIEAVPEAIREVLRGGAAIAPLVASALLAACAPTHGRGGADGGPDLRPGEAQVLRLLAGGASPAEIGVALDLPVAVVTHRLSDVLEKVHAYGRLAPSGDTPP